MCRCEPTLFVLVSALPLRFLCLYNREGLYWCLTTSVSFARFARSCGWWATARCDPWTAESMSTRPSWRLSWQPPVNLRGQRRWPLQSCIVQWTKHWSCLRCWLCLLCGVGVSLFHLCDWHVHLSHDAFLCVLFFVLLWLCFVFPFDRYEWHVHLFCLFVVFLVLRLCFVSKLILRSSHFFYALV